MENNNINLVFADEGRVSISDNDDRTEESLEREAIYDKEISPLIKQLIEKCKEYKMPLFLELEFNKGDFSTTCLNSEEFNPHPCFSHFNVISKSVQGDGVNIDKYFNYIIKKVKEEKCHGSVFLMRLGYEFETGEYNWNLANNMLIGAKP